VVAAADPLALAEVRRVGAESSWELARAGRRLAAALAAAPVAVPRWATEDLAAGVAGLAARWEALDGWVGRVGDAVASADALPGGAAGPVPPSVVVSSAAARGVAARPTWVDALSDEDAERQVLALGRRLRGVAPFIQGADRRRLQAELAPLVARVRARWPEASFVDPDDCRPPAGGRREPTGLEAALAVLSLPGEGRAVRTAGVAKAFAAGLVGGKARAGDEYDEVAPELARTLGHIASGLLVFGDVRDAFEESAKNNWKGAALAAAGVIPVFGDAAKGAEAAEHLAARADELADAGRLASDVKQLRRAQLDALRVERFPIPGGLAIHDTLPKAHVAELHIAKTDEFLVERLSRASRKSAVSTFSSDLEAEASIGQALAKRQPEIESWLEGGDSVLAMDVPLRHPVGRVLERGDPHTQPGHGVRVVLLRHDWDFRYRILTAFPTP
jgi:hypothetical protein